MEECNLSPFSSPGKNSFSPRYRKTLSPYARDEKEKMKLKVKPKGAQEKHGEKRKVEV